MKLIWTYSSSLRKNYISDGVTEKLIVDLYHQSIKTGSRFHSTCVYTTKKDSHYFQNIVDEIILLPTDLDLYFMDDIKFYVLVNENEPYTLIDGDLILNEPIIKNDNGIGFEKIVPFADSYYKKYNSILEDSGISNVVHFWKPEMDCFNIGLISLYSKIDFKEFYDTYNKMKDWYRSSVEPKFSFMKKGICIEMSVCTYLLTQYIHYKNIEYRTHDKYLNFKHYSGTKQKLDFFKKQII